MKERLLRYYLLIFGVVNTLVIALIVPIFFGDRLLWHPRNLPDEAMLSAIYLTMGIVMLAVAQRPLMHKAFIDFVILGNCLHAIVMLVYAQHGLHITIDVLGIGMMGLAPLFFYPWGLRSFLRYGRTPSSS
jgi:hypothetical protein